MLSIGFTSAAPAARAAGTAAIPLAAIPLGKAASFAVLAGTPAVTNSGPTAITGDLGIYPSPTVAGFPSGTVSGSIHRADKVAVAAMRDFALAYEDAAGRRSTVTHAALGGLTLAPGVYTAGGRALDLTGTLILDAANDPAAVWIFHATSDLVTASSSVVRLINGAQACNGFWQVSSSATLGAGSTFAGTILALTSIALEADVTLDGRALARDGEVTLVNDRVAPSCSTSTGNLVAAGGPPASVTRAPATVTLTPAPAERGSVITPIGLAGLVLVFVLAAFLGEPPRRRRRVRADFRWRAPPDPW